MRDRRVLTTMVACPGRPLPRHAILIWGEQYVLGSVLLHYVHHRALGTIVRASAEDWSLVAAARWLSLGGALTFPLSSRLGYVDCCRRLFRPCPCLEVCYLHVS